MKRSLVLLFIAGPVAASAQGSSATTAQLPAVFTRMQEVRLAQSAAPAAVSGRARVYVLEHGRYVIADSGTSDVVCQVMRTQALALEPECGDAEAANSVLAVDRFRVERRIAGWSDAKITTAVADSVLAGAFRLPARPAMVYMMSSGQRLYNDDGKLIGRWQPHVMVYSPFLRGADLGLPKPGVDPALPVVDQQGTAFANLIVVTHTFVDPLGGQ